MRLINARTLELETFNDDQSRPKYAVLSHRWVDGQEVLYKDFTKQRNEHLHGWWKIRLCCSQAVSEGLEYAWVDTCCIDKNSSAELSEAINSMFQWYANAHVCYAYLPDIKFAGNEGWEQDFVRSSWFTRSWTLQELLAPSSLVFYDSTWTQIGRRSSLSEEIAEASGIHLSVFTGPKLDLNEWSVAQRMSWASKRTATRVEDVAYSLLGIFDVNMPLLYGEGHKAFLRLQEEIIRQTYDHTIFAWSCDNAIPCGILAASPLEFANAKNVVQHDFQEPKAYTLTNLGLAIELPLEQWLPKIYWAGLNCTQNSHDQLGIWLVEDEKRRKSFRRTQLVIFRGSKKIVGGLSYQNILPRQRQDLRCEQVSINVIITNNDEKHLRTFSGPHHWPSLFINSIDLPSRKVTPANFYQDVSRWPVEHFLDWSHYSTRNSLWFYYGKESHFQGVTVSLKRADPATPCTGIICLLAVAKFSDCLSAFKLGFDRDFNPICIVAESCHEPILVQPDQRALLRPDHKSPSGSDLNEKTFWQCDGFEDVGWQDPSNEVLLHPKHMLEGLWALRGRRGFTSSFTLQLVTNPDRVAVIYFEKLQVGSLVYSFSLRECMKHANT